jgi:hypothetical protein
MALSWDFSDPTKQYNLPQSELFSPRELSTTFGKVLQCIEPAQERAEVGNKLRVIVLWPCEDDMNRFDMPEEKPSYPATTDLRVVWLNTPESVAKHSPLFDAWFTEDKWEPHGHPELHLSKLLNDLKPHE